MRRNIEFSEWSKNCPDCGVCMYYSNKYKLTCGIKTNSVCKKCKYKKVSNSLMGKCLSNDHKEALKNGWIHRKENGYIHPMLDKHHSDESIQKMKISHQKYKPWLGKHHSNETKIKMSESWKQHPRNMLPVIEAARKYNKGRSFSIERRRKISESNKGRKHTDEAKKKISMRLKGLVRTDETKEKLRVIRLKQLKDQGVVKCFNKKACEFIDLFGKEHGFQFKHGNNGGEVMISGYMVDGYDKNKNIVFEYDEKPHETPSRKVKDLKRCSRLILKSGCKVLRYSEMYNTFYWSFPDRSEIFIKT